MARVSGIGILGTGRVSRDHAYAVAHVPNVALVAAADPDEGRCRVFAGKHGCDGHTNHAELLARDDVDLVLAGVPHGMHGELVVEALEAGKHVLVEKPMAITLEECDAMVAAAERNGVRLMVGHTQRFFPANVAVKRLIDEGKIGDPVMVQQWWHKPFGLAGRPPWMLDRAQGGGMWLMNGAHMLDILLWFVPSPLVSVKGMVTSKIVEQQADDSVLAFFEFENGVCATLAHSGCKRPEPPPAEQYLTTETVGTEGTAGLVSYEGHGWINTDGEDVPVRPARDQDRVREVAAFLNREAGKPEDAPIAQSALEQTSGILDEVAAFVASVEADEDPPVSVQHARDVVEAILAVEESSRTGREVRMD